MALNPIAYTEKVVESFLRYQLTAYPFADADLHAQMRRLLSLEQTRNTPLLKGPYLSLSRSFKRGAALTDLAARGTIHPHLPRLAPHPTLHSHQEQALDAILARKTTLVSTGTGSGKTESFLYPIIDRCLRLRDSGAPAGVLAVLVYPMNALAEDQLMRLRQLLAGTGITFGMYVGKTPERRADVIGPRLDAHSSRADYEAAVARQRESSKPTAVHPAEERCSREELRTPGEQPRILLTNVKQLELLLTRQSDVELFESALLEYLVFDEAHTFSGAQGAETACLIRRLRAFCDRKPEDTVCIATSATLASPEKRDEAGREFASRFFGVDPANVVVVGEAYEQQQWETNLGTIGAPADPVVALKSVLAAVDAESGHGEAVAAVAKVLGLGPVDPGRWESSLYAQLSRLRVVFEIANALQRPRPLASVVEEVGKAIGRAISEEEILIWLALGAAARDDERPLLRPVVHAFVRGIGGAIVRFPTAAPQPELWLSAEDADPADGDSLREKAEPIPFPVLSCTTCGQHYFEHFVEDLSWDDESPRGGESSEKGAVWRPLGRKAGGQRLLFFNRLISAGDDDDDGPSHAAEMMVCRFCGALHQQAQERCFECGRTEALVAVHVAAEKSAEARKTAPTGRLARCLSCGAMGGQRGATFREPCRPVRAVTVSDVYVLAQDMVRFAERRRLLVFTDNRQDAAFQAGWMRDHARRFRLRSLMAEKLEAKPLSVGDLTAELDQALEADDHLSQSLAPEVWNQHRKENAGMKHAQERKRFLRIQVLREITMGSKQRVGLEPWGRLLVQYVGLTPTRPFITRWASVLSMPAERLLDGVAALLDRMRRGLHLLDREGAIFSRFWNEGDAEIMNGYLPLYDGVPKALKLQRKPSDEASRITQWLSTRGATVVRQAAKTWGVPKDDVDRFVSELWEFLVQDARIIAPVVLTGFKGRPLAGCDGAHQIDADRVLLSTHEGVWRCRKCRRAQARPSPFDRCLAFRCDGTLVFEQEVEDNYDLALLDSRTEMIRPREHSAQVPASERERLEHQFKAEHSDAVNALVCTATLEMGVDIGGLDAVLLRNVPPLPSNYWQRAGRAGRRHRMAVTLTYARASSHDRAYFADPEKMLAGAVEPPRFNLRNELMVAKHVHATVLTRLRQLAGPRGGRGEADRAAVAAVLADMFPPQITSYLFEAGGQVRTALFSVAPLADLIRSYESDLMGAVRGAFQQGWPESDADAIETSKLLKHVRSTASELEEVLKRLKRRLDWALAQIKRLSATREKTGTLEPDDDLLFRRCDILIKRYKGQRKKTRQEAEGYDDINTYGVLAAEGFLPGYGLESGSVIATAQVPTHLPGALDFDLPRPPSLALREYVPGNLIYANGHRFVAKQYRLQAVENLPLFQVDTANQAVADGGGAGAVGSSALAATAALGISYLKAIPVCDVELPHVSAISDDEDYRFQMPVMVLGLERGEHEGGRGYRWGSRDVLLQHGVRMRLVNVGAKDMLARTQLGYPVCTGCGQSRSPFASKVELDKFRELHRPHVGADVANVGFYADIVADALKIPSCSSREEAFTLAEALRIGASRVLDMEREDLDVLVIGRSGSASCDALLYDPMPGGSGLLEQLCDRFDAVVRAAMEGLEHCPSRCSRACVDCMLTFRNSFFHEYLDRNVFVDRVSAWGEAMSFANEIPPARPVANASPSQQPTNEAERRFKHMLAAAGFPTPEWQKTIDLGRAFGTTIPDAFFEGDDPDSPGICIYVDGLSRTIHGDPGQQQNDLQKREVLRSRGYTVFPIAASELDDVNAMKGHFFRIARAILGKERAEKIRNDAAWFETPAAADPAVSAQDPWASVFELIPKELVPLAEALRREEVQVPDDFDKDILVGDQVGYGRALMVWKREQREVRLVADTVTAPDDANTTYVRMRKDEAPASVAKSLLDLLRGTR